MGTPPICFNQMIDVYERVSSDDLYLLDYPIGRDGVVCVYDLLELKREEREAVISSPQNEDLLRRWLDIPDMSQSLFNKNVSGAIRSSEVEKVFSRSFEAILTMVIRDSSITPIPILQPQSYLRRKMVRVTLMSMKDW